MGYNWRTMTVLVGIVDNETIYIGADRGATDEQTIISISRPKISIKDGWIFAYSGSLGTGQLLEFIDFPAPTDDIYRLVRLDIVSNLKNMIDEYGKDDEDNGVDFLIGSQGRLFEFSTSDWSVTEVQETAVGSGNQIALGSLYTTLPFDMTVEERITLAVSAAINYSPTCQGPLDILSL